MAHHSSDQRSYANEKTPSTAPADTDTASDPASGGFFAADYKKYVQSRTECIALSDSDIIMTVFIKHKLNDVASISDTNGDLKLNQSNVYSLFVSCTCNIGLLAIDYSYLLPCFIQNQSSST